MTATTVRDLRVAHLGARIRIDSLHQQGTDFGAGEISIEGELDRVGPLISLPGAVWVSLRRPRWVGPLPLDHPCQILDGAGR